MNRRCLSARVCSLMMALSGFGCASSEVERTEIILVVDSNLAVPAELDEIAMHVEGPGGVTQDAVARLSDAPLPRSLGLVRKQGPLAPLNVLVTGRVAGQDVLERRALLAFVEGRTLVLPMHLVRACVNRSCGAQTCSEQGCIDPELDPQTLTEWSGNEPSLDARADADASVDASLPEADAGQDGGNALDAGDAARDAAPDATRDAAADAARDAASDAGRSDAGSCQPTTEQCNGRDDDCDGVIDDGFRLNDDANNCGFCGNACGGATRACCNGMCRSRC